MGDDFFLLLSLSSGLQVKAEITLHYDPFFPSTSCLLLDHHISLKFCSQLPLRRTNSDEIFLEKGHRRCQTRTQHHPGISSDLVQQEAITHSTKQLTMWERTGPLTSVECSQGPEKMLLFFKTIHLYCHDLLPLLSPSTHLILLIHPTGPTSLAQMPNLAEVIPLKKVPMSPTNDQQNNVPRNVRLDEVVMMPTPLT